MLKIRSVVGATTLCITLILGTAHAQLPTELAGTATGAPPHSSTVSDGIDTINLGNLNVHIDLPIRHKAGRGLNFDYVLSYDSDFWSIYSKRPDTFNSLTQQWTYSSAPGDPSTGYAGEEPPGWSGGVSGSGYSPGASSFMSSYSSCPGNSYINEQTLYNFSYVDNSGSTHNFPGNVTYVTDCSGNHTSTGFPASASDGSGIILNAPYSVTLPSGAVPTAGGGEGITDANGNYIIGTNSTIVDTTGQTALTYDNSYNEQAVYSFTNSSGQQSTVTMQYTLMDVATNFGCNGTAELGSSQFIYSAYLPTTLTLADGRHYTFTYEPTPGLSGKTTGRMSSMSLPSGGSVSYTYSPTINCSDGSPMSLTKIVNDNNGHTNTWTYTRSISGSTSSTNVSKPDGTAEEWQFLIGTPPANPGQTVTTYYFVSSREVDDSSGNPVEFVTVCFNSNCSSPSSVTYPISTQQTLTSLAGAQGYTTAETLDTYDGLGNLTDEKVYDYSSVSPSFGGSPGALLSDTQMQYASLGSITNKPQTITANDGQGHTIKKVNYYYDQSTPANTTSDSVPNHTSGQNAGNLTTIVSGGLTTSYSYYDTGMLNTSTDAAGNVTTYLYGQCGYSYLMYTMVFAGNGPPLINRTDWDCNGGVPTDTDDPNNLQNTYTYDSLYRLATVTDPTGTVTTYTYPTTSANSSSVTIPAGNYSPSLGATVVTYDGLGRAILTQKQQSSGSSTYDTVAVGYDAFGHETSQTLPYAASLGQYNLQHPVQSLIYDPLGRTVQVTDGGGGYISYGYSYNDVFISQGPAPSGEQVKRRNIETDGLGNVKSVCEMTAATGSGACGQANGANGFLTSYTYQLSLLRGVQQNVQPGSTGAQSRSLSYDSSGRVIQENNPETGTISYVYDADPGNKCPSSGGNLVRTTDARSNVICYTYDGLNRLTSKYQASGQSTGTPYTYFAYDTSPSGWNLSNVQGMLAEAYTCKDSSCTPNHNPNNADPPLTDEYFSYSYGNGVQAIAMSQYTPSSSGPFSTTESTYANGVRSHLSSTSSGASFGCRPWATRWTLKAGPQQCRM